MGAIGEDNEPLIPSYLSEAKSASAHQLALSLSLPVSSLSFSHCLSLPPSFTISLSHLLCALPLYPPSVVVHLSTSGSYFGA